jgi:hypothetical protein
VTNLLERGLRPVAAPPELWDRVRNSKPVSSRGSNRMLVWAMAATVVLAAVALSLVRSPVRDSQQLAFHCQNPAQLRAWVKANTGLDVPLRGTPAAAIQLIGARAVDGRAEIAYREGNRDSLLLVSRAKAGSANAPHSFVSGNVSAWVMAGQQFSLACADPAALQLACKLCHLD